MLYSNTKLRFLTEGLLLRQLQNDTELHAYDLIILDEVCTHIQKNLNFLPDAICLISVACSLRSQKSLDFLSTVVHAD